jgi:peptide/nickel transport system substrate-binding protein
MKIMKRCVFFVSAFLVLLMTACGQKTETTAAASGAAPLKVVNVGVTNDPSTVSPLSVNNVMASYASSILFMPLTGLKVGNVFVYRVAESITTEDNVVFTIKINQKVKWTDGKPVTADDVIFTINTIANPAVGMQDPSSLNMIEGTENSGLYPPGATEVSGVKKIDDYTLTITTKYPVAQSSFNLVIGNWLRTMPKHIMEKEAPENVLKSPFFQNPTVTNGPLVFGEYVPSQYLSYKANDTYFLGRPKIDMLNFKILSGTQITAQLENGEIDMNFPGVGYFPTDDYDRISSQPHLRVVTGAPGTVQVLFYNNAVLNNVKLRQAMDLALDRDSILKNIFKGNALMTKTPVTNQIEYWNEAASKYTFDPEQAKKLLAESGWDLSRKLTFLMPTGNSTRERICTMVVENFKAIGLNVVIEKADFSTTVSRVGKRDYEISIIGIPDNPLNQVQYFAFYVDPKTGWTGYDNPRMNELLTTIRTSVDPKVLKDAYYEAQALAAADVPVSGLYCEFSMQAINKRVLYGELAERGPLLDLEQWDVE